MSYSICIGTIGSGAWLSTDSGDNWKRSQNDGGLWSESRVYGLTVHPTEPRTIFAGADDGIHKSTDGGRTFTRLDSPMNAMEVWKIAVDPSNPETIFAGTRPAALFRSQDGGKSWRKLAVEMAEECPNVRTPRVTALVVDPSNPKTIWAGVEVDGVRRSLDGGDTWTRITEGVPDPDIHDVTINLNGANKVLTTTPREIFATSDAGAPAPFAGASRTSAYSICPQPSTSRTTPPTVTPGTPPSGARGPLSAGSAPRPSATSASSTDGGRSACSKQ